MSLIEEIDQKSKEISTDSYPMSIGEMVNLYRDKELNVHPEFQRFFRWNEYQKSRFVESLLLGIPIPSIFLAEQDDGTWEVVDGLQRFSTILELMGILEDEKGNVLPPLALSGTKYLPSLEGKSWSGEGWSELPAPAKLKIKRSKLDLKIVLKTSDASSKYELFQRLNTGGSLATDQEVRNCILIMINPEFFEWLNELASCEDFQACLPITDRQRQERYDMELVVRFIVLANVPLDSIRKVNELGSFLTDRVVEIAQDVNFDRELMSDTFYTVFACLNRLFGEDALKKFDPVKERSLGAPLISMFESMALGLGHRYLGSQDLPSDEHVTGAYKSMWSKRKFMGAAASGVRASSRIPVTMMVGREVFVNEN